MIYPGLKRMSLAPQQLLTTATEAALIAGAYLLEQSGKLIQSQISEKKSNDFVTEVDHTSERLVIDYIRSVYPDHDFLAEESGSTAASGSIQWIIDPLDGTTNYIRNIPVYAVSIAACRNDTLLAGVVYNPALNERFSAAKGHGATLNDTPITIGSCRDFRNAFLATGFPHQRKRSLPPFLGAFNDIFHEAAGIRRLGAAALDLCYTACGRFDAFWELGLHSWDMAAGALIVTEAGGIVTDFEGGDTFLASGNLVAANRDIHQRLKYHLCNHFSEKAS